MTRPMSERTVRSLERPQVEGHATFCLCSPCSGRRAARLGLPVQVRSSCLSCEVHVSGPIEAQAVHLVVCASCNEAHMAQALGGLERARKRQAEEAERKRREREQERVAGELAEIRREERKRARAMEWWA